jgi:hypothetical protein
VVEFVVDLLEHLLHVLDLSLQQDHLMDGHADDFRLVYFRLLHEQNTLSLEAFKPQNFLLSSSQLTRLIF